jgi:hypothetical protein|tara:strand:- start:546 stop:779 length:234 start_codon:yes stop_codon:yes gene_type:complete
MEKKNKVQRGIEMNKPDDGGFFGPNKLFYYWMLKKYKDGVKVEKLKYWMFQKDMKAHHEQHQRKLKAQSARMQQPKL